MREDLSITDGSERAEGFGMAESLSVRPPHASLCHQQHRFKKPAVRQHQQELQYPLQSSLPFASLPCPSLPSAALTPLSSALRKERQTHFHTNGVRACSPGTRWNCKYFIFAREPRAITAQPLSPRFHSLPFSRCPSFICSPVRLTSAVHPHRPSRFTFQEKNLHNFPPLAPKILLVHPWSKEPLENIFSERVGMFGETVCRRETEPTFVAMTNLDLLAATANTLIFAFSHGSRLQRSCRQHL